MRPELDAQLVKDHPILFGDRHGDMRTTAMCWGFECGDGWYDLLKEAADKLEPLCQKTLNDWKRQEKSWYKYVRNIVNSTAKSKLLFRLMFKLVEKTIPGVYKSPLAWYGPPRASQVKEKFGTLRFYMSTSSEEMEAIISAAEKRSAITCESCGKKGRVRGRRWLYTACSKHVRRGE